MIKKLIKSFKEYRRKASRAKFYTKKNLESSVAEDSPSGRYELTIEKYKTEKGAWSYTRGIVKNKHTSKTIAVVDRNYSHFWSCWVEDHPDGHDYILCGEDYQGQTIIRLDDYKRLDYRPEAASRGNGFCWVEAKASPDKTTIGVCGCYWGSPYDACFFDFTEPFKHPVEIPNRFYDENPGCYLYSDIVDWKDNNTVLIGFEHEVRKSDGMDMDELYEEDEEAYYKACDENDVKYEVVTMEYKVRQEK